MAWFLLFFFSVYGGMNAYLFWKIHAALPGLGQWQWLIAVWLLLMIAAPVIVYRLDRRGWYRLARLTSYFAYLWLAGLFWLCMMGFVLDAWNGALRLIALGWPGGVPP